jgi:fumarylpyruvate hydrolase
MDILPTIFPLWKLPMLPIAGRSERFPVHRIFCIGRNYAEHVREMGNDLTSKPIFFTKPSVSLRHNGDQIPYPLATENFHHEVELVVALDKGGTNIPIEQAQDHIYGYAVGVDLTRRDLQEIAKTKGQPWDASKAFDDSAPCSELNEVAQIGHPSRGAIWLSVNGEMRQQGDLNQLIWNIPEIISTLSQSFHLQAGDVIFTGTPSGVGRLEVGDQVEAVIEGISVLRFEIVEAADA